MQWGIAVCLSGKARNLAVSVYSSHCRRNNYTFVHGMPIIGIQITPILSMAGNIALHHPIVVKLYIMLGASQSMSQKQEDAGAKQEHSKSRIQSQMKEINESTRTA